MTCLRPYPDPVRSDDATKDKAPEERPRIVLAANTSWNLVNFRGNIVASLQEAGYQVVAIAPNDAQSGRLAAMGVEVHSLAIRSAAVSPLGDLALLARYIRLLREIRPVAFLGFTIKPNVYGSIAARVLGIPTINNVSGLGTAFIRKNLLTHIATTLYRQAFRKASTVFFQNEEDREQFVEAKILKRDQTRLLPGSGVDLDRFAPVQEADTAEGEPFVFLMIARLLWDKGVKEYVDAAQVVRRRYPDARFQILGSADVDNRTAVPRETLDRWIAAREFEYLGMVDDVRPYITAADCVVLPSYREGLPRSLLEASAMARPIIASDVPGCRDVVEDGVTGYLCRAKSAASLAEAMVAAIAASPEQRRAMGAAGRAKVEREFAVAEVTRRYLDAVKRASLEAPAIVS